MFNLFKTSNYWVNMDDKDIVQQEGGQVEVEVEEEPTAAAGSPLHRRSPWKSHQSSKHSIADDSEDEEVKKKKNKSSLFSIRNIIISVIAVAGATAVVTATKGANRKEQQFVASLNAAGSSKSAKRPPPYCDAVTCGRSYTDKVYLNDDLLCGGDVTYGTDSSLERYNCAVTLEGPDAELDCDGYTIYETTSSDDSDSARNCDETIPSGAQVKVMKQTCGMYYVRGVCLKNGATLKNCGVQKFYEGVYVKNSGMIKSSTMRLNTKGVSVEDDQPGDKTEIYDTDVSENGVNGIDFNRNSFGKVVLDSVKANSNYQPDDVGADEQDRIGNGMTLDASEIKLKDVDASRNGSGGIVINTNGKIEVEIEGTVLVRNNIKDGFTIRRRESSSTLEGDLELKGDLYITESGRDGFRLDGDTDVNVEVKRGGSFLSCSNGQLSDPIVQSWFGKDVRNNGAGDFGDDGFTCGTEAGTGNLPGCTPAQCSAVECS